MNHPILVDDYLYGLMVMFTWWAPGFCLHSILHRQGTMASKRPRSAGWLLARCGYRMLMLGQRGEGVIAKVNPEKFEVLNREQIIGGKTWTMPILANGLFYTRNARGDLFCTEL